MKQILETKYFKELKERAYAYNWGKKDWSDWGLLFRFLIIICRLLAGTQITKKKKRKPSAWSLFAGDYMRKGKTIKEAAADWKKRKKTKR